MDIYRLSTDYRNLPPNAVHNRTIMADVVIVDQIDPARPKVYLLRDEVAKDLEEGVPVDHLLLSRWKELFHEVGEAWSIDRHKRAIVLENKNRVSCKHLIIAKGDTSVEESQEAFRPGLSALAAALRLRKERLMAAHAHYEDPRKTRLAARLERCNTDETLSLLKTVASTLKGQNNSRPITNTGHRFFEVIA